MRHGCKRRNCIKTIGTAALIGTAGCLGQSSGSGTTLRYVGWGGNTQEAFESVAKKWSDETGNDIKFASAGGNSEIITQLERNPGDVDITFLDEYGLSQARPKGLLADINHEEQLPNFVKNIEDGIQNIRFNKGDAIPRDIINTGYLYNIDKTGEELSSWAALTRPEYKGEVTVWDSAWFRFGNGGANGAGLTVNDLPGNQANFQKVVDELNAQDDNIFKYWSSGSQGVRLMREGEAAICEMWDGRARALTEEKENIRYAIPEEGTLGALNHNVIPASSEKKETALNFMNWLFKKENLVELSQGTGYAIPVKDAPSEIRDLPGYVDIAANPDQITFTNLEKVKPELETWSSKFQDIKQ